MPSNELYLAIFITIFSIIILAYLSARVKSVLREEKDANEIIQSMLSEIGRRMKSQDMRILDQQVRLDIIDVRKGSMNAIRAPHVESSLNTLNNNNITNQQFDKSVKSRDVTGTELSILRLLVGEAKSPIDIQKIVSLSREHVSRIMKEIYHKGLVSRETGERPYRYKLTDSGEKLIDISVRLV